MKFGTFTASEHLKVDGQCSLAIQFFESRVSGMFTNRNLCIKGVRPLREVIFTSQSLRTSPGLHIFT